MSSPFIHLRVHSEYSLIDGTVRVKPLVKATQAMAMPAVAITDHANLFALVKFYKAALAEGIKPIAGCDVYVSDPESDSAPALLVLLAQNEAGYRKLGQLLSRAYDRPRINDRVVLEIDWLMHDNEGLIVLSGAAEGDVGRAIINGHPETAITFARRWAEAFPGRYYLELQRLGRAYDDLHVNGALSIASDLDLPIVATNDVRFIEEEDYEAHEVRVCIHEGRTLDDPRREQRYTPEQYLKTSDQMAERFADLPEAIDNSWNIAIRCSLGMTLGESFLPEYPVPEGMTMASFLSATADEGLAMRFDQMRASGVDVDDGMDARYRERLAFELGVINSMGFPGYFLIVMEFIQWAKDHDIPVGPGRGSGAGSLVAFVLEITDVDPLEYDLLFERFLNPERVSLPDFDIDFCMDGRDRVIQHVTERYGAEAVSQIITFGTMAAKAVVRDVARVQGKPYGLADKLSKLIPFEPGMTLQKALEDEPQLGEFIDSSDEAQEIMDMAFRLEGLARNVGRHAGGVVIAPTVLTDFSPTYRDQPEGGLMTQYDMTDVEQAGLVKFDFLGLRTLTIIDQAVKSINARRGASGESTIDINALNLEDPEIYQDLKEAKTTAVFQLESRGMKDLMKRVAPSRFADIVALVALFRPGPLQLADDFIRRKHGLDEVDYLHPSLQHVLADTYGVMLYQEQVMQIAQILAGYSLADADLLRRAMGKKKPEEMAKQREVFLAGALKNDVDERQAGHIFDLMEKFAGYGFNKPHSVCYALLAYQTAWLKHYYPADFMAAVMSSDMQNTDKIVINIEESRELGLTIAPPDVNQGTYRFVASEPRTVVYGLGAVKGLGEGAIQNLVEERDKAGAFDDLFDLCRRIDTRRLNKRALEALVGAGALDSLVTDHELKAMLAADRTDQTRAYLDAHLEQAVQVAEQESRNAEGGLSDLFGDLAVDAKHQRDNAVLGNVQPLSMQKRLAREKDALGLYLTGHPIDVYRDEMRHLAGARISELRPRDGEQRFAGWVIGVRSLKTQRGNIVFVTLDDRSGRIEVSVSGDTLERGRDKLMKDSLLVVSGQVSHDEYSGGVRVRANQLMTLTEARGRAIQGVSVSLMPDRIEESFAGDLAKLLAPYQQSGSATCPVFIEYEAKTAAARLRLDDAWSVVPNDELIAELRQFFGRDQVRLDYDWQSAAS